MENRRLKPYINQVYSYIILSKSLKHQAQFSGIVQTENRPVCSDRPIRRSLEFVTQYDSMTKTDWDGFSYMGWMKRLLLAGIVLCPTQMVLHAEIYRWTDEDGVVNYTQQKPTDRSSELVSTYRTSARNTTAPVDNTQPPELKLTEAQQRKLEDMQDQERARQNELERVRASNCDRSTKLLARLTSKGRVRVRSSDGEERNIPEEERQQRIANAQQGIAENCQS